ncbi:MAG: hypothetical protein JWQ84_2221 [Mucilaginibacter sp.]|nr:hypothetical protein [Mucilaginibacter sp.]
MAGNRYLLDTHSLIWFQENNPKIPEKIMQLIQEPGNTILFSQLVYLRLRSNKKLANFRHLMQPLRKFMKAINDGFTFLPIHNQYLYHYNNVPLLDTHRDPFDRLLIASAIVEDAAILSIDDKLCLYPDLIQVIW